MYLILEGKGSMDAILDNVMLSGVEDEDRFRSIIDGMIDQKLIEKFKVGLVGLFFNLKPSEALKIQRNTNKYRNAFKSECP